MTIRLATQRDIPAAMALEERHYVGNIDVSEHAEGFISILHSRGWFESAVNAAGVHVAASAEGAIQGFIAVTAPPASSDSGTPAIVRSMLKLAKTLEFDGLPIAEQRYAFRGPVLVDRTARGRGLYSAFNLVTRKAYRERFDVGVLFVADDNPRSLHTTTPKLGAEPLASLPVDGTQYRFLAFEF